MAVNLKGRSFLTLKDFTAEEIEYLIDLAMELKEKKKKSTWKKRNRPRTKTESIEKRNWPQSNLKEKKLFQKQKKIDPEETKSLKKSKI